MRAEYINITGDDVDRHKVFSIDGASYSFRLRYNLNGFFTCEIWDSARKELIHSNKVTYGQNLIDTPLVPIRKIIPLNLDRLYTGSGTREITRETLGREIRLYTNIEDV